MAKKKTNIAFVKGFMEQGALHQPFVLEALRNYANEIIKKQDEIRAMKNQVVSPEAWINIAKEYIEAENEYTK
jgi:hypothetical protein